MGITLLHEFENCELKAYKKGNDPWTIGWGATWYEDGSKIKPSDVITQERADALFVFHLRYFEDMLTNKLGSHWVSENQFAALLSFLYNIGPGSKHKSGLFELKTGGPSTLWKMVLHNSDDPLIAKEFVKWISKGTIFEDGLKRRREAEVKLYYT